MTVRNINGIDVDVQRKDIKNVHIHVKDGPSVIITVPRRYPDSKIDEIVMKRFDWITSVMERKCVSAQHLTDGGTLELIGKQYTLNIIPSERTRFRIEDGRITIWKPEGIDDDTILREIHRESLKRIVPDIMANMFLFTGLSCSSWQIRYMTSRWGTCNTKTKKIWLSTNLAKRPLKCIEYVVLHELVHTVVPNHGPDFKAMLDMHMPDWKERRRLLNS